MQTTGNTREANQINTAFTGTSERFNKLDSANKYKSAQERYKLIAS